MSQSVAVVCEARADSETVAALVRRVVESGRPHWFADCPIDELVSFRGFEPDQPFFRWDRINALARELKGFGRKLVRSEFADDFPDHPVALEVQRALRLLQLHTPVEPEAVVFLKDSDNRPDRRSALGRAQDALSGHAVPVVVGVAHTERECWLLAGFEPQDDAEREAHRRLCRELTLDPCRESDRLAAPAESDPRHPKCALSRLTGGDPAREAACLRTAFTVLEANGRDNGLADFLDALRTRLIYRLYGGPPPRA